MCTFLIVILIEIEEVLLSAANATDQHEDGYQYLGVERNELGQDPLTDQRFVIDVVNLTFED